MKCVNYNKTKVWFFSIDLIKDIIKNFKDLSEQKYDIIRTRFEYMNIMDKVKKENPIDKFEIKIDDNINNSKNNCSIFKPFQQKINIRALHPNFGEVSKERQLFPKNNKFVLTSRNHMLNGIFSIFNKNNSTTQPKIKLKILTNKSQNQKNLISIKTENNYIKNVSSNMYPNKVGDKQNIGKISNIKSLCQKIFMNKINKTKVKDLFKSSNDETL